MFEPVFQSFVIMSREAVRSQNAFGSSPSISITTSLLRLCRMAYTVTSWLVNTHSQPARCRCAIPFHRHAHQAAAGHLDQISIDRLGDLGQGLVGYQPLRLACRPKASLSNSLTLPYEHPKRCFASAARALALGPTSTPPPVACEVCSGCPSAPLMTMGTVATVGYITSSHQTNDFRNIRHILLMLMNIPQPAPTLRATMQLDLFR